MSPEFLFIFAKIITISKKKEWPGSALCICPTAVTVSNRYV